MSRSRPVGLLLFLLTVILYAQVRNHDFVNYDDPLYVTENAWVQAGLTDAGVRWAFTTWHASNWHPITWLSHMLDVEWFGVQPGASHLVNVLLHAINSVLLFLLLKRMTGAHWRSALVASLFAWHPLHVESVAWISERKDVLSTLFWLLTLWCYTTWVREKGRRDFWLALLFFAIGLMAKPMLVTLPCVLLLLDAWPLDRWRFAPASGGRPQRLPPAGSPGDAKNVRQLFAEKWPFFLLTLASCVITFLAQRGQAVQTVEQVPVGERLANAIVAVTGYLRKMVWPIDLSIFYPLHRDHRLWPTLLALLGLFAISAGAWKARRTRPYLLVGWLWFLGTLVPVIGLVQVGGQAMADRYTYIPLIGLFIGIAWGGRDLVLRWHSPRPWVAATAGAALAACATLTWIQQSYWRDSVTLFTHALAVSRENAVSHINLGIALEKEGRREEALQHYLEALRLEPNRPQVHGNLGNVLDAMGRFEEAVAQYQEALRLRPGVAPVYNNLGLAYAAQGRMEEAVSNYLEAIRLQPGDAPPHFFMGNARLKQGRISEAIAAYRETLRRDPGHPKALNQLARILAADPDETVRNGPEAVRLARRAAELTGGRQPIVLDTLAMALAESGRYVEARQSASDALQLLQAIGETNDAALVLQRLQLYEGGKPFREKRVAGGVSPPPP